MSWVESLKQYCDNHANRSESKGDSSADGSEAARKEQEVLIELRKLYAEQKRLKQATATKKKIDAAAAAAAGFASVEAAEISASIPRFYVKRTTSPPPAEPIGDSASADGNEPPPAPVQSMATQLRREARIRYLVSRAEQLLDDREMGLLWETILLHSVETSPSTGEVITTPKNQNTSTLKSVEGPFLPVPTPLHLLESEKRLNYDAFLSISHSLPASKAARYFKPTTFLAFPEDAHGRISSRALWRYISKKIQLTRLRIGLTCYDDVGYGYLREQDLENYVYDQLATLPPLQTLERDFYPYYVFTAVRKFIFFLDPHRRGKLRVKNIVESSVILEFDALRYPHGHHQGTKKNSWFSAQHTQDVYAIYLGLDSNQNGMLSREEFRAYNGGNLTSIFIEGLFAEYRMYPSSSTNGTTSSSTNEGSFEKEDASSSRLDDSSSSSSEHQRNELEMDYKTFLDFVLAMEYKTTPASIAYFFKILDIKHQGYLDTFTLNYWFRAVSDKMAQMGHEQADIVNVVAVRKHAAHAHTHSHANEQEICIYMCGACV